MESKLRSLSVQQKKQPDSKSGIKQLLQLNSLVYKVPMQNSLVISRNIQQYQSDGSIYNQNTPSMDVVFQTGSQYVDGSASNLQFTLSQTNSNNRTWDFGAGSALNMFKTILVIGRNGGQEIDRFEQPSVFKTQEHKVHKTGYWKTTVGKAMGYGEATLAHDASKTFTIPLEEISSLFATKQLLVPQLCSGLRLRFIFNNLNTALKYTGGAVGDNQTFEISACKVNLTCCKVTDSAHRAVENACLSNGLEIPMVVHHRETSTSTSNKHQQVISKACARAMKVSTVYRVTANIGAAANDSILGAAPNPVTDYQVVCGHQYFGQQPFVGNEELYYAVLQANERLDGESQLTPADFTSNGYSMLSRSLETSHLIKLSGISVNNSKQVRVKVSLTNDTNRTADTYLSYMQIVRVFPNNITCDS